MVHFPNAEIFIGCHGVIVLALPVPGTLKLQMRASELLLKRCGHDTVLFIEILLVIPDVRPSNSSVGRQCSVSIKSANKADYLVISVQTSSSSVPVDVLVDNTERKTK